MPVVRELVNVFSFKQDKKSRDDAEKSFRNLAKTAGKVGLGLVAGITAATLKIVPSLEKARAEMFFFGRDVESVDDKLAKRKPGSLFSVDELTSVEASMASLSTRGDQLKKSMEFLQKITVARGFNKTLSENAELLTNIVKNFDVESVRELGGLSKELAEQLKKAVFSEAFQGATEEQRLEFLLGLLEGERDRLDRLGKMQLGNLTTEWEGLKAATSDLVLKNVESFGGLLAKSAKFSREIAENMLKSNIIFETFDKTIESIANQIVAMQNSWWGEWLRGGSSEEIINSFLNNVGLAGIEEQKKFFKDLFSSDEKEKIIKQENIKSISAPTASDTPQIRINKIEPIEVNVSGDIRVTGDVKETTFNATEYNDKLGNMIKNALISNIQDKGGNPVILQGQ